MTVADVCLLLFYLSALTTLTYYRLLFYPFARHKKAQYAKKSEAVSVIICAKNEAAHLKENVSQIANQQHPNFEIVLINDHSKDETWEIMLELAKNNSNIKAFDFKEKKEAGKKAALNFGIRQAKNEILLLTDADCSPNSPFWIQGMTAEMTRGTDIVLGVSLYNTNKNFFDKLVQYDALIVAAQYIAAALAGIPYMSVGRNVSYRKSTFNKIGFDNHKHIASGDDDLFIQEAADDNNTSVCYHPDLQTQSPGKSSWKSFLRQKTRHHSTGKAYSTKTLLLLAGYQLAIFSFHLSFIYLMIRQIEISTVLTIFFLKKLVELSVFRRIFSKIGVREAIYNILPFDFIWVVFLMIVNLNGLFSKKDKW